MSEGRGEFGGGGGRSRMFQGAPRSSFADFVLRTLRANDNDIQELPKFTNANQCLVLSGRHSLSCPTPAMFHYTRNVHHLRELSSRLSAARHAPGTRAPAA